MTSPTTFLSASGIFVRFGRREVLSGLDLDATAGSLVAVTGPSGVGKTTLLLVLAGVLKPDAGTVDIGGIARHVVDQATQAQRVAAAPAAWTRSGLTPDIVMEKPPAPENLALDSAVAAASQRLGARVGFVPQTLGLAPWLTAAENVALVLQVLRLPPGVVRDRTAAVLAAVGLAGTADRIVSELSGGQRQRVAVARSLAAEPDVLIADEPTAELDAENRQIILDLLLGAARDGSAVIVATHDPDVSGACGTAYELRDGKLTLP